MVIKDLINVINNYDMCIIYDYEGLTIFYGAVFEIPKQLYNYVITGIEYDFHEIFIDVDN